MYLNLLTVITWREVFWGDFYFLYYTFQYFKNVFKEYILHICINRKEKPKHFLKISTRKLRAFSFFFYKCGLEVLQEAYFPFTFIFARNEGD